MKKGYYETRFEQLIADGKRLVKFLQAGMPKFSRGQLREVRKALIEAAWIGAMAERERTLALIRSKGYPALERDITANSIKDVLEEPLS